VTPLARYHAICDLCGQRQPEYQGYLNCRRCLRIVCEPCSIEYDPDPPGQALCWQCDQASLEDRREDYLRGGCCGECQ